MHKPTVLESVLALFAGRARAAAIYGDLLELAATRPRTSFWIGYLRTLLSLSWRSLAAFFAGAIVFAFLYDRLVFPYMWFFAMDHPHIGEPLGDASLMLCFLLPFAAIRYGLRDRAVQLAFAAALVSAGVLLLGLGWLLPEFWLAFVLLIAVCIVASTPWRTSLVPLAASCTVGAAIMESFWHMGGFSVAVPGLRTLFPVFPALVDTLATAIIYSWIHRRMHRPQLIGAAHA